MKKNWKLVALLTVLILAALLSSCCTCDGMEVKTDENGRQYCTGAGGVKIYQSCDQTGAIDGVKSLPTVLPALPTSTK